MSSTSASRSRRLRFAASAAVVTLVVAGGATLMGRLPAQAADAAFVIPAPAVDESAGKTQETAILAGGCFWGVQGVFQHVEGVSNAVSGYAGGTPETATYETVSGGRSAHAEAVAITYDPREVTYGELLQIYFSVAHDPTQLNRQGPDSGTQYRSAIFPTTPEQAKVAAAYIAQLDKTGVYPGKIVTTLEDGARFFPAEAYHQDFLVQNPTYPYIVIHDQPKIDNLKEMFPEQFRNTPVLVASAKS
ncbi:peptide methionine sulfoxide reductase MsrA [Aureimonas sp. SA4125]|uniref:peptide-methionine (S)-S-oxide reductase MsrA n=1 Tax=Aureimonas sp. SA4125 TaxID=2826993 RepID=UPI001CC527C4|nr:peptide-methionine (S)-S-oxide reductase MsrA [Aureimonas sp. SA4125]BDA82550.1 peptide methionine sulfoxide reductase MsrA [Aureimonas sp. SA4125]